MFILASTFKFLHYSIILIPKTNLMKKTLFIIAAILLYMAPLMAQQVGIEKSAEFDEPDYGWNKLLQLKNGNTLFFHSTKKDGIDIVVYNKQRKQIATRTLESRLWDAGKMRQSKIVGLYEINGEPVIFVVQADSKAPTLYRMRINGNNGAIVKEDELGNLPKTSIWKGYAMAFGNVDMPDIIVEKDPNSDCYVVIFFDGFSHETNKRIKVEHYDGAHKVLNTVFYDSPEGKYKYLRYIGAAVDGNKRVFITAYGYNGKADEDVSPKVIISKVNVGETKFSHSLINVSNDFNDTKSVMIYNKNTNKLQLMTLTTAKSDAASAMAFGHVDFLYYRKKSNPCIALLNYIDPETMQLLSTQPIKGAKIDAYGQLNIEKEYEFDGVPQNMVLNKDNTTTILMEELAHVRKSHSSGPGHISTNSYTTQLGPVGISELSDTGAELKGYTISKLQQAQGTLPILYMAGRSKGVFSYPLGASHKSNDNEFLSYDYINAPNGRYVIFNDLPRNTDKTEDDDSRKMVTSVSATNTMCYKLNDPKMDKFYLFGEPDGKKESTFCYIESSDYNRDVNTYATMIVERDGRSKSARIAWITFQ